MDGKGRRGMGRGALPSPPPLLARSAPAQVTLPMPVNRSASQAKGERGLPHQVKSTWQTQQTPSLPKTPCKH